MRWLPLPLPAAACLPTTTGTASTQRQHPPGTSCHMRTLSLLCGSQPAAGRAEAPQFAGHIAAGGGGGGDGGGGGWAVGGTLSQPTIKELVTLKVNSKGNADTRFRSLSTSGLGGVPRVGIAAVLQVTAIWGCSDRTR